jgi:hypothetical protein
VKGLLLRLSALDSDAEAAMRVIAYFDRLPGTPCRSTRCRRRRRAHRRGGGVAAARPADALPQAVPELLRLGPDAEVVAPADLRDRMIDALETMAGRYRRTAS